jgi:hypothetical protein
MLAKYPVTVSTSYHPVRAAPCPPKTERTSAVPEGNRNVADARDQS